MSDWYALAGAIVFAAVAYRAWRKEPHAYWDRVGVAACWYFGVALVGGGFPLMWYAPWGFKFLVPVPVWLGIGLLRVAWTRRTVWEGVDDDAPSTYSGPGGSQWDVEEFPTHRKLTSHTEGMT